MFSNFVLNDYWSRLTAVPYFFKGKLTSSNRSLGSNLVHGDVFGNKDDVTYDAYDKVLTTFFAGGHLSKNSTISKRRFSYF